MYLCKCIKTKCTKIKWIYLSCNESGLHFDTAKFEIWNHCFQYIQHFSTNNCSLSLLLIINAKRSGIPQLFFWTTNYRTFKLVLVAYLLATPLRSYYRRNFLIGYNVLFSEALKEASQKQIKIRKHFIWRILLSLPNVIPHSDKNECYVHKLDLCRFVLHTT